MPASSKKEGHILEDVLRVAEGALGTVAGFRKELEQGCKQQAEWVKQKLQVPSAEEWRLLKAMQVKLLEQQEEILGRLDLLEKQHKNSVKSSAKPKQGKSGKE